MEIRYYIDPETELLHIYRHNVTEQDVEDGLRRPIEDRPGREHSVPSRRQGAAGDPPPQEEAMRQSKYPAGWDEERVRRVLEHYETQSDEEAVAEDEAAYEETTHTAMEVPVELVPVVRELIAKRRTG